MAEHHVTPVWLYLAVFFALLVLTGATVGVAYLDLGWANNLVAMAIAVTKALLVLWFFMHLRYSTRMTKLTALAGFFWLGGMILVTLMDYLTRTSSLLPVLGK
ncbi:MAG TPA: cytochrome C oxidase subunit IV family protein [Thermoanaerobaculia bacterium]|nr:cytochrome C oxidase subunit IV family protein [Thermoanaerobaculia bacterium]